VRNLTELREIGICMLLCETYHVDLDRPKVVRGRQERLRFVGPLQEHLLRVSHVEVGNENALLNARVDSSYLSEFQEILDCLLLHCLPSACWVRDAHSVRQASRGAAVMQHGPKARLEPLKGMAALRTVLRSLLPAPALSKRR